MRDYKDAKKEFYSLAHKLGSDEYEQRELVDALHKIETDQPDDKYCIIAMLGIFYDGLRYGNWPWEIAKLKK